jgi:hypothetical protein
LKDGDVLARCSIACARSAGVAWLPKRSHRSGPAEQNHRARYVQYKSNVWRRSDQQLAGHLQHAVIPNVQGKTRSLDWVANPAAWKCRSLVNISVSGAPTLSDIYTPQKEPPVPHAPAAREAVAADARPRAEEPPRRETPEDSTV